MAKYALALHTTTRQLGLSLTNFKDDKKTSVYDLDRDLSTHLQLCLQEFIEPLKWSDLEFIAVAIGPGSFTATRIGVVTARTLAQQLKIPLFGVSSTAAFAWEYKNTTEILAVQMEASRGQLFVAIYQIDPKKGELITHLADMAMTPTHWQQTLDNLNQPYQLLQVPPVSAYTVVNVLEIAHLAWQKGDVVGTALGAAGPHWSQVTPFYGQNPVV